MNVPSDSLIPGDEQGRPRIRLRIEHLWLGLPIFVLIWKSFVFPLPLLDFWWHLKAGEVIVTTRSIPQADIFSYTAEGKPFILGNWLAEVVYHIIYRIGGLPLLIFVNTVLLVGAISFVLLLCWESTRRPRLTSLAALIAACSFLVSLRSQVFSFFFFSAYYWVLSGYPAKRRTYIWLLPPLMLVWVNLHGAFILGPALVAAFLCLETIRSLANRSPLSKQDLRVLALVLVLCGLATLANPVSYRVYSYLDAVMSDPSSQNLVVEWQPPRIDAAKGWVLFYGLFYALMVVLISAGKRPNLTDVGLFVGFSLLGLKASRNGIWFTIIATPILARYLCSLDTSSIPPSLARLGLGPASTWVDRTRTAKVRAPLYGFNLLIACGALIVLILVSPWVRPGLYKTSLMDPRTPIKAVDYIERNRLEGNILHPQHYGDYLIWRLWPRQRSFFDGRVHLFGEPFVRYYGRVFTDSHWEELLKPYKIRYLLLDKARERGESGRLIEAARSSSDWRLRYEDDLSVLFEAVDALRGP